MFFYHLPAITIPTKNCFNKFANSISSSVKNNFFTEFIINTNNFVSKTTRKLVKQKVVYPYKYIDSFEKFSENKLPDRSKFFSSLKDRCIRGIDYFEAINV